MTEPVFAFGLTDVGGRKTNEDAFHMPDHHEAKFATYGRLYVVADGTGGQEGGRTASAWAAEVVAEHYYDLTSDDLGENLRTAIQTAHQAIFQLADKVPSWRSMSTTLVAVVVKDNEYWVAHVGDSRLYLVRGDKIKQVTQDHTWQEDDDNFGSLTRWLGGGDQPTVEVDLHHDSLKDGDVLILCTDGLYSQISKDDMRDLTQRKGVKPAVQEMISIAKAHGTTDNTTAIAIRLGVGPEGAIKIPRPVMIVGGGIAAAAAGLILIVALLNGVGVSRPTPTPTPTPFVAVTAPPPGSTDTPIPDTLTPTAPVSTLRPPTDTPTPLPTPRPVSPTPTISVPTQPAVTATPQCPPGKSWNPEMKTCKGQGPVVPDRPEPPRP